MEDIHRRMADAGMISLQDKLDKINPYIQHVEAVSPESFERILAAEFREILSMSEGRSEKSDLFIWVREKVKTLSEVAANYESATGVNPIVDEVADLSEIRNGISEPTDSVDSFRGWVKESFSKYYLENARLHLDGDEDSERREVVIARLACFTEVFANFNSSFSNKPKKPRPTST